MKTASIRGNSAATRLSDNTPYRVVGHDQDPTAWTTRSRRAKAARTPTPSSSPSSSTARAGTPPIRIRPGGHRPADDTHDRGHAAHARRGAQACEATGSPTAAPGCRPRREPGRGAGASERRYGRPRVHRHHPGRRSHDRDGARRGLGDAAHRQSGTGWYTAALDGGQSRPTRVHPHPGACELVVAVRLGDPGADGERGGGLRPRVHGPPADGRRERVDDLRPERGADAHGAERAPHRGRQPGCLAPPLEHAGRGRLEPGGTVRHRDRPRAEPARRSHRHRLVQRQHRGGRAHPHRGRGVPPRRCLGSERLGCLEGGSVTADDRGTVTAYTALLPSRDSATGAPVTARWIKLAIGGTSAGWAITTNVTVTTPLTWDLAQCASCAPPALYQTDRDTTNDGSDPTLTDPTTASKGAPPLTNSFAGAGPATSIVCSSADLRGCATDSSAGNSVITQIPPATSNPDYSYIRANGLTLRPLFFAQHVDRTHGLGRRRPPRLGRPRHGGDRCADRCHDDHVRLQPRDRCRPPRHDRPVLHDSGRHRSSPRARRLRAGMALVRAYPDRTADADLPAQRHDVSLHLHVRVIHDVGANPGASVAKLRFHINTNPRTPQEIVTRVQAACGPDRRDLLMTIPILGFPRALRGAIALASLLGVVAVVALAGPAGAAPLPNDSRSARLVRRRWRDGVHPRARVGRRPDERGDGEQRWQGAPGGQVPGVCVPHERYEPRGRRHRLPRLGEPRIVRVGRMRVLEGLCARMAERGGRLPRLGEQRQRGVLAR